ncbi:GNAT family N-acetyltransferase [uncultured Microbacterium sp.]|uniref:GNAT family N-acetyltransferase n=1 Tax=uncultured Microbacterium sp. TaxID=191216 RepID=UPI0028D117BF|nr:GNAT family N-acetyltransferase [uncultured Microbacterium sp.]
MPADIRELAGEDDLDAVADFFARSGYGPPGRPVTGAELGRVFRERGVRLFLVAEDRGRIVGTIGYAVMSGRRVAPPGHLFAGMFVIAPHHRAGMLAGRLFTESFERLVASGVRGLRVEVDPANSRAFPLYVRVGFRALDGMTPDEEGYVELVSVLPGVTADLLSNGVAWTGGSVSGSSRNWRSIRSARAQSVDSGIVRLAGGAHALRYDFELPGKLISATGRVDDASIVSLSVNGAPAPAFTPPTTRAATDRARRVYSREVGTFTVALDDHGTLVVSHPRHVGSVLVDPHPVASGSCAGSRRPLTRRVQVAATDDGWRVDDGRVTRVVGFSASGIRIAATSAIGGELVSYPWMGLRAASLALSLGDDHAHVAHAVRGRWPLDLVDFEAVADADSAWPAQGAVISWSDAFSGVTVRAKSLHARIARLEGWHLARLAGEKTVGYELSLAASERLPPEYVGERGRTIDTWRRSRRGLADVLQATADAGTVTVAPEAGLVEWNVDGVPVLSSTFPSRKRIGPLTTVSAALWACAQPDRSDADQGAVWPTDAARLPFRPRGDGLGWTLVSFGSPTDLGVSVTATADGRADETVVSVALASVNRVRLADPATGEVDLEVLPGPWRTWTRSASFRTNTGWLHLTPERAVHPEILIRSTAQGLMIAAFSRIAPELAAAVWRLRWEAP